MRHFVLYRAAPFLPKTRRGKSMLNMLFDRGCALILSCFFKSRTKCSRQGTSERLGRRKAAKRPVRYRLCGELIRGLQNLETPCKGDDFTFFLLLQKEPKSMLPRQGQTSCLSGSSRKGTVLFFSLLRKERGVAQRVATLWTPRDGSKLYRLYFFVTFPTFVPKPVCGATRFFGCFEPVRKGYCSADARLLFFEKGLLYCKLTAANVFKKGSCSLSLLRWKLKIVVC